MLLYLQTLPSLTRRPFKILVQNVSIIHFYQVKLYCNIQMFFFYVKMFNLLFEKQLLLLFFVFLFFKLLVAIKPPFTLPFELSPGLKLGTKIPIITTITVSSVFLV